MALEEYAGLLSGKMMTIAPVKSLTSSQHWVYRLITSS